MHLNFWIQCCQKWHLARQAWHFSESFGTFRTANSSIVWNVEFPSKFLWGGGNTFLTVNFTERERSEKLFWEVEQWWWVLLLVGLAQQKKRCVCVCVQGFPTPPRGGRNKEAKITVHCRDPFIQKIYFLRTFSSHLIRVYYRTTVASTRRDFWTYKRNKLTIKKVVTFTWCFNVTCSITCLKQNFAKLSSLKSPVGRSVSTGELCEA